MRNEACVEGFGVSVEQGQGVCYNGGSLGSRVLERGTYPL